MRQLIRLFGEESVEANILPKAFGTHSEVIKTSDCELAHPIVVRRVEANILPKAFGTHSEVIKTSDCELAHPIVWKESSQHSEDPDKSVTFGSW